MTDDEQLPIETEVLALKALEKRVGEGLQLAKAVAQHGYAEGESRKFRSPSGLKLGTVLLTDPEPAWQVTDRDAFEAHLRAYPANLEEVAEIDDLPGAVAYLTEHAPQFLAFVTRVTDDARKQAMEAARAGDEVPGVSRVKPRGVLQVRPDKQAADAVAELVAAGRLTWDGRRVLEQGTEQAS